jgi:hypothetical protein
MPDINAKLVLTQEDMAYLWHGGTLAIKIDAPETTVSLDLSASQRGESRRQIVRIKRVPAQKNTEM